MSKARKLTLTKLSIETKDGTPIDLTIEEARELYNQRRFLNAHALHLDQPFSSPRLGRYGAPFFTARDRFPHP